MSADDEQPEELVSESGPAAWVPAWVLGAGLTDGELRIYVALRTFADRAGKAHPRPEVVATRASNVGAKPVSVRSVHNAYGRFRQLGLMDSRRRSRPDGTFGPVRVTLYDVQRKPTALHSAVEEKAQVMSTAPDSAVDEPPHHTERDHRTVQGETTAPRGAVKEHTTKSNTPQNTPPTHQRAREAAPEVVGGERMSDLVGQVRAVRPFWSPLSVEQAAMACADQGRTYEATLAALLSVADDPASIQPSRVLADGPWWRPPAERRLRSTTDDRVNATLAYADQLDRAGISGATVHAIGGSR